ncbi:putative senescence regulator S40 [Dioscorea sansibarensis]
MAGRNGKYAYHLFSPAEGPMSALPADEFDESEIWGSGADPRHGSEFRKAIPSARSTSRKKASERNGDRGAAAPASLPVNIPDWSKILKEEYRGNDGREWAGSEWDDDEGENTGVVIPPHEYLWRNRAASFSVQEGIGRTLKGRDLRRVRNAIWEKTGFQD